MAESLSRKFKNKLQLTKIVKAGIARYLPFTIHIDRLTTTCYARAIHITYTYRCKELRKIQREFDKLAQKERYFTE